MDPNHQGERIETYSQISAIIGRSGGRHSIVASSFVHLGMNGEYKKDKKKEEEEGRSHLHTIRVIKHYSFDMGNCHDDISLHLT